MDPRKIEEVAGRAVEASSSSVAGRERAIAERRAWRAWRARWGEVQGEVPERRMVLVCLSCERFCDRWGTWLPMPPGLAAMLWQRPATGILHGVCHSCLAQMIGPPLVTSTIPSPGD